jgi:ribosomal protein S3AE
MRKYTRELLVTAKVADSWRNNLDQKIEELIDVVCHVHDEDKVNKTVELLDVYPKRAKKSKQSAIRKTKSNRPFQFMVCRN